MCVTSSGSPRPPARPYARNAEALRNVQPEDVLPGDIDANLGAPWIPAADIEAFAAGLFGVAPSSVTIGHLKKDAVWCVDAGHAAEASVAATAEYGTARANGTWLLDLALNMKTPVIYDTIQGVNGEERVVNQDDTLAAREKQKRIKEAFKAWVFAEPERTERLVRLYNDTYNNLRPRLFDGSHLDFPGMSQGIRLNPHQKDAVWRGMSSGNTLLAHAVGAGKTFTMAATGMKMKQAGLRKEAGLCRAQPYAGAIRPRVHAALPQRTAAGGDQGRPRERPAQIAGRQNRRRRVGRHHHDAFQLRAHRHVARLPGAASCASRSRNTSSCCATMPGNGAPRNIIKSIEKQKAHRQERLKDLLAEDKKDDGLVFDELGVDHVFIDEAHYFKNLETPTKMDRVAGIQTGGSERAFDLYMKARYLGEQHPGHGVTFATGTPISNTMVEMYTMQRFLDPEGLQEPRHRAFRRLGRHLRRSRRYHGNLPRRRELTSPQPLRQIRQPARARADVPGLRRRADAGDARPAPPEARRRQGARGRLPDVR